jgi:hypothetical protein
MKETNGLAGDLKVSRNEGLLTAEVDGELMAMSVDRGICYGLNTVGTRIWDLIAEPRSIDDLCAQLVDEYGVDAAQCRSEVVSLIEELRAEGLATVRNP